MVLDCFILHNYCEQNNIYLDEDLTKAHVEKNKKDVEIYKQDHLYSETTT